MIESLRFWWNFHAKSASSCCVYTRVISIRDHGTIYMGRGCATYFLREVICVGHFIVGLLPHPIEVFVQRVQDVRLGRTDSNMCECRKKPRMLLA